MGVNYHNRIDNITDPSLDVFKNLEIYKRDNRSDIAAIFNARTNCRFISVQDGYLRGKLSGTTQGNSFPCSRRSNCFNIIFIYFFMAVEKMRTKRCNEKVKSITEN